jgi:hypothetical protein
VVYIHLSEEAVRAGTGVARVEQVGPVLLNRLQLLLGDHCTINLKPVIDLPTGHTPVDSYEIPARLREQLQLRNPADIFPYAAAVSRLIDLDHTIPYLNPTRTNQNRQPRTPHPLPPQSQNPAPGRSDNPNPAPGCGDHPTTASIWSTPPAPTPSATPRTPRPSGTPPRRTCSRADAVFTLPSLWLDVRSQSDSLIASVAAQNVHPGPVRAGKGGHVCSR